MLLRTLLKHYNFRKWNEKGFKESSTVRIYLSDDITSTEWIEVGIRDSDFKTIISNSNLLHEIQLQLLEKTLNSDILNSKVAYFAIRDILHVYLQEKEKEEQ